MLSNISLRKLTISLVVSQFFLSNQYLVHAYPVDVIGDAPPLSRSIGMINRQDSTNSDQGPNHLIQSSLLSLGIHANLSLRSASQTDEQYVERGLIGDTVKGLLGPLSIIPGVVQVSDILFGDGEGDRGLLGKLGFLLAVEPNANNSTTDAEPDSNKNETAVNQAAQASMRYTLTASKKGRSQVFLVPVNYQAGEPVDQNTTSTSTEQTNGKNDTMTVKMMMHMLDKQGVPIVMCATYGSSPPSDLGVDACTSDTDTDADAGSNGNANVTTSSTQSSQLFTYHPSSGSLRPMFVKAADGPEGDNSTSTDANSGAAANSTSQPSKEMKMHFVMTASPDEVSSESGDEKQASPTDSTSTSTTSQSGPSAAGTGDQGQSMQRITLGRQFVQQTSGAPKLDIVNGKNAEGKGTNHTCEDESSSSSSSSR